MLHFLDNFVIMKRSAVVFLFSISLFPFSIAQGAEEGREKRVINALTTVYKGDTIPTFQLYEVIIYGRKTFPSIRKQKKYDKLVRDVKKAYPIAKEVRSILVESYLFLQTLPNDKSKEEHIQKIEKGVWEQYYPVMKKMTFSQGKLLIKLIDRECNQTSYELINAFMGSFKARFYQVFASIFGASLKKEYNPDKDDEIIEEIIYLIDNNFI